MPNHSISWLILIIIVAFLIYAAIAIAKEKDYYLKNAKLFDLGEMQAFVPPWWSLVEKSETKLKFERKDERFDWNCQIEEFCPTSPADAKLILQEHIEKLKIELDSEEIIHHLHHQWANLSHLCAQEIKTRQSWSFSRIEGIGTQDGEHRVYLDLSILINPNQTKAWSITGISSILNGSVEGPYVEEVVNNLKLTALNREVSDLLNQET